MEKARQFEVNLLKKIKAGEGSIFQIMVLSHEYNIGMRKINKILKKHIDNNYIFWSGSRFKIKYD